MKKAARIVARVGIVLVALVAVSALLCLDGVDYSPYVRSDYYRTTTERLHARSATNHIERGELSAGFGRALLTPTTNAPVDDPTKGWSRAIPLAGYGNRNGKPATGVHDDLFVKAVAIRVGNRLGIMFGADALIVPREVADAAAAQLKRELGLDRAQLYFSASHTHCSLGGWGEGVVGEAFAGKFDPNVRAWFASTFVSAARQAVDDLKPAEFGRGRFDAHAFIRNRLVGEIGKVDPEFSFAVFKQTNGRTAVVGSYSAHATVLPGSTMEFSADYPGYWQRAIEKETGGMAVFLAGGVGSHGPVPRDKGFAGAEGMGEALARSTMERFKNTPLTNAISFGILAVDIVLPPTNVRISDGIRLRPWVSAKLLPGARDSFAQGFRLDDAIWISTPCDFSGEMALEIKDMLGARGFRGVITSFNGDYIGYVIPARYYHLNGYEPRTMSFYGPNVPDYLDELVRSIATDLAYEARQE